MKTGNIDRVTTGEKNVPFLSLVAWHWSITRILLLTRVKGSCQQKIKTSPKLDNSI